MADQIYSPGPLPAPLKYNVPGSQRMIPRACQALYNGSGASGDYIPTLIFRSQAGHVISRAILGSTITAGDDAEVSWFPHVGGDATGAADLNDVLVASGGMWLDVANLGDTPYTVPAGSTDTITFPNGIFDPDAFGGAGGTDDLILKLDAAFHATGLHNAQYALSLSVLWENADFPRAVKLNVPLNQTVTVQGPQYFDYHAYTPASTFTVSDPTGLAPLWCRDTALVLPKTTNRHISAGVINGDVVDRDVVAAYMMGYCFYYGSFS